MNLHRAFIFFIMLLFAFHKAAAQYYDTGTDPASAKWLQINTERFRVIYPESYGEEGIKFAESLESSYQKLSGFYPGIKFKLPVIIHNYTTISNGYVAWAPRRMEIYPTPEQNSIPQANIEQLTLHEMAHVMQMRSLYNGVSKVLSLPFGEHYYGILTAYLPMWLMEGDAVLMETVLSESGRGRTPAFSKQLKAILAERGAIYGYDKMLLGSYRDYVPDEYRYGYQMAAWANEKYGHRLWRNALEFTGRYPFSLFPLNISFEQNASLTKSRMFKETFSSLGWKWNNEEKVKNSRTDYGTINTARKKEYINYHTPVMTGKDSVVAIKTSMYNPPVFVLIDTKSGREKQIHTPGNMYPYFLSGASGKVVWVENHADPRWENRNYSVVKIIDINSMSVRQVSHRTRYMAAGISPDGRLIAVVENSPSNKNTILILDAFNGNITEKIPVPGIIYPQRPQWSASGKEITFIALSDQGESIVKLDIEKKEWETLTRPGRDDLQASFLKNDSLFYVSSASGTDNIWLLTPRGEEKRITNSRFGIYDVHVSENNLLFTDYSFRGSNVCLLNYHELLSDTVYSVREAQGGIDFSENPADDTKTLEESRYKPEPYRKWQYLFRFHSWMPFYASIEELKSDPSAIKPGFTLLSQNHLSTVISSIGYEYANGDHLLHTRLTWKGWLPVFETSIDYGGAPDILKPSSGTADPSVIYPSVRISNSVSVPLTFSHGNFTSFLWTSVSAKYYNRYIYIKERSIYDYGQYEYTGRIYFSNYSRSAIRDIYPRWAQMADYSYTFFPDDRAIYGPLATFRSAFYMPGLIRNHGIRLRFETDYQKPVKFLLYNRAELPRAYNNVISQDLKFFSADYVMPLFYPDLNIPGLLYIKRLRAGLFYDYAKAKDNTYLKSSGNTNVIGTETLRSFGAEAIADFYILRVPFMISGGVQAAWKNIHEGPFLRLILNLDIYGMMIGGSSFYNSKNFSGF